MNNYPYLIKAKAKANEAKSLFCWFSAKSDSRAERKILDILEDAEINVGRGASHQLPIRTNWLIVDDLPEEVYWMTPGAIATSLVVKTG